MGRHRKRADADTERDDVARPPRSRGARRPGAADADAIMDRYGNYRVTHQLFGALADAPAPITDYPRLHELLSPEEFGALAAAIAEFPGGSARIVVPLGRLLDPATSYVARELLLETLYPQLATANGEAADALALVTEITKNETLRVLLSGRLHEPVAIEVAAVDPVSLSFSLHGFELETETGQLSVASLDAGSIVTLAVVASEQDRAARELVALRLLETKADLAVAELVPLATKFAEDPADCAERDVLSLNAVATRLLKEAHAFTLSPTNADMAGRLALARGNAIAASAAARTARDAQRAFRGTHMPDYTAGEIYDQELTERANKSGWSVSGVWHGANWGAAKVFATIGNVVTGGGQSLDAQNARLYRDGQISWNEYETNGWLNYGRVLVTATVGALTAGWGGRLTAGYFATGGALTTSGSVLTGTVAGGGFGFGASVSSDAYALVVAELSSDTSGVGRFHRSTIGGPTAWLESTLMGGMIGGGVGWFGARFANRSPRLSENEFRAEMERLDAVESAKPADVATQSVAKPATAPDYASFRNAKTLGAELKAARALADNPRTVYHHYLGKGGLRSIVEGQALRGGHGTASFGGGEAVRAWFGEAPGPGSTPVVEFTTDMAPSVRPYMGTSGAKWNVELLPVRIRRVLFPDGRVGVPDGRGGLRVTRPDGTVETIAVDSLPD